MASIGSFIRRHILHSKYTSRGQVCATHSPFVSVDTNRLGSNSPYCLPVAAPRLYGGGWT